MAKKNKFIFLIIAVPLGMVMIYATLARYREAFERQISAAADSYIYTLSSASKKLIESADTDNISPYLRSFSRENPNIEYAYIEDSNSTALYHSFDGEFQGDSQDAQSRVSALFYRRLTNPLNDTMALAICFKTTSYEIGYHSLAAFLCILFLITLGLGVFLIDYVENKNLSPGLRLAPAGYGRGGDAGGGGDAAYSGNFGQGMDFNYGGAYARSADSLSSYGGAAESVQDKIEEGSRSLRFLHNMSQFLSHTSDIHQVLEEFAEVLLKSMINTNCRIALIDETQSQLVIETDKTIVTDQNIYSQEGKNFPHQIITNNSHLIGTEIIKVLRAEDLGDKLNAVEWEFFFPNDLQSVLFIRLNARGRCLGYVLLGEKRHWERSPFNREKIEFCMTLVNQAIVAMECATLYKENHDIYLNAISSLTNTLDARDPYTHDHSRGVTQYALLLAQSVGLGEDDLEIINNAGLLHDIGKIAIPDYILHKVGKLTNMEFQLIKEHPIRGAQILEPIKEFRNLIPLVSHHHEHYDGNGYHAQLKGEEIPLGARIMAIADSYHAMTSDRPYRKGMPYDKAIAELVRCRGTQFDPALVDVFVNCLSPTEPMDQSPQLIM